MYTHESAGLSLLGLVAYVGCEGLLLLLLGVVVECSGTVGEKRRNWEWNRGVPCRDRSADR